MSPRPPGRNPWIWRVVALAAMALLGWFSYAPGLTGGFLFDDYVNLDALGRYGDPLKWDVFWRYVTSGTADPLGRPISLVSFLIDARTWPGADPAAFLRTNLIIHLFNGALLFLLLEKLGATLSDDPRRALASALLGACMWLLHPLFVSTTLYAVQRQAMLPATFILMGLLGFVHGRNLVSEGRVKAGAAWIAIALVGGTVLAALSKANGLLLPLLAGAVEATVLMALPEPVGDGRKWLKTALAIFVVAPSLVIAAYLLSFVPQLTDPIGNRDWTIAQRLLTEPRVLFDYLGALVTPRVVTSGLFNDGYPVSTGWWSPWTTLPALVGWLAAILAAIRWRRSHPAASLGLLFFAAGHSLESSTVPLELYFEHRNYVPAMLLFWPLARWLSGCRLRPASRIAVGLVLVLGLAGISWQRAALWGQPDQLARLWALKNPDSVRAQVMAAVSARQSQQPGRALEILDPLWSSHPLELQVAFNVVDVRCAMGGLPDSDAARLEDALRKVPRIELLTHRWLGSALDAAATGACPGLDLDRVASWIRALASNAKVRASRYHDEDVEPLLARLALRRGNPDQALAHFNRALHARPRPDTAARQVVELASLGHYAQALAHLDEFERIPSQRLVAGKGMGRIHQWVLAKQDYWPRELGILRKRLNEELSASPP